MKKVSAIFLIFLVSLSFNSFTNYSFKIAKLKYSGGGDWYSNKTSLPNLIKFCNKNLKMNIAENEDIVDINSSNIFVHMTGHGNVVFSSSEAENLRNYLVGGGFLHIDDNYGLDKFIRVEMKKVFPNLEFIEIPFNHAIYHQKFDFNDGLPKIHEHDGKPAQGFGIFHEGRLVCFYSYESDLGNGWENQEIYNDSDEIRTKAFQMGANILSFALTSN